MNTHEEPNETSFVLDTIRGVGGKKRPTLRDSALFRKKVLEYIMASMYPAAIAKKMKVTKNKLYYHIRVMEKAGIIFLESKARPHFYRVAPSLPAKLKQTTLEQFPCVRDQVLNVLIGHDRLMEVNTHAVKIKLDVVEGLLPNVGRAYGLRHGVKRNLTYVLIDGVSYTVFLNRGKQQSITIQPPAMYGKNETENIARCLWLGETIRKYYHIHWPHLKLDAPTIASEHHQIEDPAQEHVVTDCHTTFQVGPMKVDGSPTVGFETEDRLTMQDYRMMPLRMKTLMSQFTEIKESLTTHDELTKKVNVLEKSMEKLVGMFERFMAYVSQPRSEGPPGEFYR